MQEERQARRTECAAHAEQILELERSIAATQKELAARLPVEEGLRLQQKVHVLEGLLEPQMCAELDTALECDGHVTVLQSALQVISSTVICSRMKTYSISGCSDPEIHVYMLL